MATTKALANLLAMPPPLRYMVLGETIRPHALSWRRLASHASTSPSSSRSHTHTDTHTHSPSISEKPKPPPPPPPPPSAASPPPPPTPLTLSFLPGPSNDPKPRALPALPPTEANLARSDTVFTSKPPRFLYAAPRFLHLPVNTRIPEICLLGRSNVGKSTLLNALSGASGSSAGRSHGLNARKAGQAITSARAGSTKTMNAFAFGPPTPFEKLPKPAPVVAAVEAEAEGSSFGASRSEKRAERADRHKHRERPASCGLVVMDMPGYGLNSQKTWGVEIAKYLKRRAMLRGAVLLIDAVAGVKDGDRMALNMLRDAGVRTTVVLTKADKLGYSKEGQAGVDKMCLSVWEELRRIERKSGTWREGEGWEKEIWVTGAGDPKNGGYNVLGARLAICKMAGLVEDTRVFEVPEVAKVTPGRIVSFDELGWAGAEGDEDDAEYGKKVEVVEERKVPEDLRPVEFRGPARPAKEVGFGRLLRSNVSSEDAPKKKARVHPSF
ncbi:hypothetical protein B0T22DRAFT_448709 [Podospora appendiculata]|uniref:EngB-type G domain-containing protein n=1 Tax=Podospora appendiculata TaxID=314037 RepID=A0AAE0XHA1_9PEZI|nr:hypothetical protein B0T22DRAFT_448709 [Podospora appendiculata]